MLKTILALCVALAIAGCLEGEPKLDASTVEAFRTSVAKVKEGLSEEKRAEFDEALIKITIAGNERLSDETERGSPFADLAKGILQVAMVGNPEKAAESIVKSAGPLVDGKSADEIIRIAKERELESLTRQLSKLDSAIATLPERIAGAERAAANTQNMLSSVQVEDAKYYWSKGSFRDEPTIDFRIANGLDVAIARVFIEGILETPGRTVPWVDNGFNYKFRGGLEPGEEQHLRLVPNRFGDWGHQDLKELQNTILTLQVVDVETASGERLAGQEDKDAESLREELRDLEKARAGLREKVERIQAELAAAS